MHVQKVKVSINKAYKKNYVPPFPIFSFLQNLPSCALVVFIIDMNMYKGISKHSWEKIVQLLWTVEIRILGPVPEVKKICIDQ